MQTDLFVSKITSRGHTYLITAPDTLAGRSAACADVRRGGLDSQPAGHRSPRWSDRRVSLYVSRNVVKHTLPLRDAAWLRQQYVDLRKDMKAIAAECDCNHRTVYYWMKRHGIPPRSASERQQISKRVRGLERDLDLPEADDANGNSIDYYLPSPEQIAAATALIRAGWSESERRSRYQWDVPPQLLRLRTPASRRQRMHAADAGHRGYGELREEAG